jgi:hypothetical protein
MAENKYTISDRNDVSTQTGIVKRLIKKTHAPRRHYIPGGQSLMDDLDLSDSMHLETVIWTWLRRCKEFSAVTISFADDPKAIDTQSRRVVEFDDTGAVPIWQMHPDRRRYLARQIAKIMANTGAVSIEVTSAGINVLTDKAGNFGPSSEDWKPYLEFTIGKKSRGEYVVH